jgi:hypothetical protein
LREQDPGRPERFDGLADHPQRRMVRRGSADSVERLLDRRVSHQIAVAFDATSAGRQSLVRGLSGRQVLAARSIFASSRSSAIRRRGAAVSAILAISWARLSPCACVYRGNCCSNELRGIGGRSPDSTNGRKRPRAESPVHTPEVLNAVSFRRTGFRRNLLWRRAARRQDFQQARLFPWSVFGYLSGVPGQLLATAGAERTALDPDGAGIDLNQVAVVHFTAIRVVEPPRPFARPAWLH